MDSDLPIADEIDESPDRIREDLLDRLYWNVFGLQSDIAVRDGNTLIPFANHAIGSEGIADPPVSKITVNIQVCQEKYFMDETDEEEYRYQPPTPLVIEKQDGTPILLNEFINQVHPFLNANKDEIFKCEDEIYTQPTELEDGSKFDGVDPAEFEGFDQDEDQSTEPSLFIRSGNIPAGSKFFFDKAIFNELDMDEFEVYIDLFVEGNMGMSFDQFWEQRAGA
ncbi:hypothetical protein EJ02DRAFT_460880 [Clathrospora elynae]|uniref:Uncharacterized protein n=1 Tax=Clathrospora elynae TaxID=706981 RepID=A0A6A5S8T0_9PLEO|nr:hypothetical protein EJ02DRAFT_460880 [Clathrospora elynae]